jgi:hypothetical protein
MAVRALLLFPPEQWPTIIQSAGSYQLEFRGVQVVYRPDLETPNRPKEGFWFLHRSPVYCSLASEDAMALQLLGVDIIIY